MKFAFGVLISLWFCCGVGGAWMLGDLDPVNWEAVLRGPLTLVRALNENPVNLGSSFV